jgi:hypothetical protein
MFIITTESDDEKPIRVFAQFEDDAEEVGAALAMAGFTVKVRLSLNDELVHEFFPS